MVFAVQKIIIKNFIFIGVQIRMGFSFFEQLFQKFTIVVKKIERKKKAGNFPAPFNFYLFSVIDYEWHYSNH